MCGRQSSNREMLRPVAAPAASGGGSARPVIVADDLDHLPVTAEELEAIEAYLMPQLLCLLEAREAKHEGSILPPIPAIVETDEGARP